MSDQITFTTAAFGGFEKKQVLDYIYKIHEEMDKDRDNHKNKLSEISIAFKELEARAVRAEQNQENLKKELIESKAIIESERQSKEQYKFLNSELKVKLDQCERILEQRKQQDEAALKNTVANLPEIDLNNTENTKDNQEYLKDNGATAQIGRVMLEAHTKANTIIKEAKIEAERIINDSKISIEEIRKNHQNEIEKYKQKAEYEANQLINFANQRVFDNISKAYDYAKAMMDDIATATNTAASNFASINNQVEALSKSTEKFKNSLETKFVENVTMPNVHIPTQNVEPIVTASHANINISSNSSYYDKLFNNDEYVERMPIPYDSELTPIYESRNESVNEHPSSPNFDFKNYSNQNISVDYNPNFINSSFQQDTSQAEYSPLNNGYSQYNTNNIKKTYSENDYYNSVSPQNSNNSQTNEDDIKSISFPSLTPPID